MCIFSTPLAQSMNNNTREKYIQTYGYKTYKTTALGTEVVLCKEKEELYSIHWRGKYLKNPQIIFPYLFIASKRRRNKPYDTISIWDINKIKKTSFSTWLFYGYRPVEEKSLDYKERDIYDVNTTEFEIQDDYSHLLIKRGNKKLSLPEYIRKNIKKHQKGFIYYKK